MTDRMRMGLALGGLTGLAAVAGAMWWQAGAPWGDARLRPAVAFVEPRGATGPGAAGAPASPGDAAAVDDAAPRFDVARIGARGATVVAGRAEPGSEVILQDRDRELGRATADGRGEFVILPNEPLAPGAHELSLRSRTPEGKERQGGESVVVMVPGATPPAGAATAVADAAAAGVPLVVLLPPPGSAAASRVLQGPIQRDGPRLGLDIVDYDENGAMRFSGTAAPGETVRVYVDQRHAGDAAADAGGRWALRPEPVPQPGRHTLRVDQMGPHGRVAARLELPFQRDTAPAGAAMAAEGHVVVQPGHNLWRIARATYGRGIRYTVIHRANTGQIRDPDRIYPGQIFNLPPP